MTPPPLRAQTSLYDRLLALSDTVVGEILDGELVTSPRPVNRHSSAILRLATRLEGPYEEGVDGPGGWLFLVEPQVHLSPDVLVPDLAGWRLERLPPETLPDYFDIAPDWVCEVLSPSTVRYDRGAKLRIYGRTGVGHVWLVDPGAGTLETYRLKDGFWVLLGTYRAADEVAAEPFQAAAFRLDRLWHHGRGTAVQPGG